MLEPSSASSNNRKSHFTQVEIFFILPDLQAGQPSENRSAARSHGRVLCKQDVEMIDRFFFQDRSLSSPGGLLMLQDLLAASRLKERVCEALPR